MRGDATHLKLENPRFLLLEGWGVPPSRPLAPPRRLHRWPGSGRFRGRHGHQFHGCLLNPWRWGHGIPPIGGGPPITFLLLIRRQVHRHQRRGESRWSRSWYSSLYYSRHSRRLSLFSFVHAARSYSRRCAVRPAAWAQGVGGSDRAAFTFTICGQELSRPKQIRHKNPKRKKKRTHRWGVGEHHE
jgi:hypothetical protein